MSRNKNQKVYSTDPEFLKRVLEDFIYLGRDAELTGDTVTVYALPRRRPKKKVEKRPRRNEE